MRFTVPCDIAIKRYYRMNVPMEIEVGSHSNVVEIAKKVKELILKRQDESINLNRDMKITEDDICWVQPILKEDKEESLQETFDKMINKLREKELELVETKNVTMRTYPIRVGSKHGTWNFLGDADSMQYCITNSRDGIEIVGLVWMDTLEGDEGYNPDGDCWCVACWTDPHIKDDRQLSTALKRWDESCRDISGIMKRKEAEEWLVNYMRNR